MSYLALFEISDPIPGRIEFRAFLAVYLFTLLLQLFTTGSFLEQGTTALVVLTAIHAGAVATLFWMLLGNALVATQIVEDGTPSSLIVRLVPYQCLYFLLANGPVSQPYYILTIIFMAATTYISLDVALTITSVLEPGSPEQSLHSTALFVLTSIWPGTCVSLTLPRVPRMVPDATLRSAALFYFILMVWIVARILHEMRPLVYYVLAGILFIFAQLAYFLLSRTICDGTNARIDGSFIATALETATVIMLYLAWQGITEGSCLSYQVCG